MKEQYFLFVEAHQNFNSKIDFIKNLNYKTLLLTGMPHHYTEEALGLYDLVFHVDTLNTDAMIELLQEKEISLSGILTPYDDMTLSTAKLARHFDLPHANIEALERIFSKSNVRKLLSERGFDQPDFKDIAFDQLDELMPPLSFPFVMKPDHDAGSNGAYLCSTLEEYQSNINRLKQEEKTKRGAARGKVLFEEYIGGNFYGAELLWDNDHWVMVGIDRQFLNNDSLCMTGISFPSDLSPDEQESVRNRILEWVEALELTGGALNVEFKWWNHNPVLIEINPRLVGANVSRQIELSTGFSPVEHLMREACGLDATIPKIQQDNYKYYAEAFAFPKKVGLVNEIDLGLFANEDQNFVEFRCLKQPPFTASEERNFSSMVAAVMASGENCEDAMHNAENLSDQVSLSYEEKKLTDFFKVNARKEHDSSIQANTGPSFSNSQ